MQSAIEIWPVRYTKADLTGAPDDEAIFFLMCGQLQNDLVILMRQLLQASHVPGDDEPTRLASTTAWHLNLRYLAARVTEGWNLIKGRFQKVLADYGLEIRDTARRDLPALARYFSDTNNLRTVRNKLAAHFDQDVARAAYDALGPDEPLVDLHAAVEGNTIFFSGEVLMLASIRGLAEHKPPQEALEGISRELLDIASKLGNVVRAYLLAFSKRYLTDSLDQAGERVTPKAQAALADFWAPLFLVTETKPTGRKRSALLTSVSSAPFKPS
jgi:hypothetical protein